ncbi:MULTISPECIES: glycosyltransferase family 2 protein [Microbacterium]|uniref:glycosyltransferase family 2 protein n=1 Tax=Microbacterium TaxID=33882 RepID=UPI0027871C36|nr:MULTISPECIES: glycosyltransferase family 2 protein [Microbacterium]MDQ1073998.1 N-acetylglucosaminyl-diphospho-decaprenol L-rhamnosyltransferase [Microbacterium sp. SORGH_AS_0969]MDQ1114224.1 N-acetylglucosaminyl-diphospho-decaprenol L-rhamnosyltransferase [Microbacterium testaceum]
MIDAPEVDLVIPVYGGWDFVRACLHAATHQSAPARVIVIDDRSPDDTADRIAADFPEVTLIRNERNLGFARACNVGLSTGTGRLVMLVNSDVVLETDAVERVLAAMPGPRDERRVGSAATLLLAPDGTVDSFGIVADVTGAGFVRFHGAALPAADPVEPPVLGPYGAVAVYARAALHEVGLFDTNIFMYGEELDLAFRLRAAGWGCVAIDGPLGTHLGGASAGRESARQRRLSGFARGYLLRKYGILRSRQGLRALTVELVVSGARLLLRRDVLSLRGRWEGWRRGADASPTALPLEAVDRTIGLRESMRMRGDRYWAERPVSRS